MSMIEVAIKPTPDNKILLQNYLPQVGIGCWIAGGAARELFLGKDFENDVDVFFCTQEYFDIWCEHLSKYPYKETSYARTYTLPYKDRTIDVQLVSWNLWETVQSIFNDFDFTICQFAYGSHKGYTTVDALRDLALNKLQWNKIKTGTGAVQRAFKYQNKGFTLSIEEIKKLLKYLVQHPELIDKDWKGE